MNGELELITLTVTPEEARKLATGAITRADHYAELANHADVYKNLAIAYRDLAAKVDRQRSLT